MHVRKKQKRYINGKVEETFIMPLTGDEIEAELAELRRLPSASMEPKAAVRAVTPEYVGFGMGGFGHGTSHMCEENPEDEPEPEPEPVRRFIQDV